jgi:hypothetical protein
MQKDSSAPRLIELPQIHDARGDLTFIEGGRHVPFDIARVYYIYNVPTNAERGGHAHYDLEQVMIALSGSFRVRTHDGSQWTEHWLHNPCEALYISNMTWREMDRFSQGAVCAVLASNRYDETDYIRDYETFLAKIEAQQQ